MVLIASNEELLKMMMNWDDDDWEDARSDEGVEVVTALINKTRPMRMWGFAIIRVR